FTTMLYATFAMDARRRLDTAPWQLAVGAMAGATALVRSLADPLGVILVGARVAQRRWRDAALVAASWAVCVVPWKLWLRAHAHDMPASVAGAYGEYSSWWRTALDA